MPPTRKKSDNNILNNLKDHVDSGDVLFVLSGDASTNKQAIEAFNCCKLKCPGRRKLDRNLHSKVVNASQFEAVCDESQCNNVMKRVEKDEKSIKNKVSEMKLEKSSMSTVGKSNLKEKKPKRLDPSNRVRIKSRGPPPAANNRKREIILRQMKNHRVSTTSMDDGSRQKLMIRPAEKLRALQDVFDEFVMRQRWDNKSLDSENISGIMNRMGLSKYGFKIPNKSPYATNEVKQTKRKRRPVIDIVPRHNCFTSENTRVPSFMGWNWTKCFSELANSGWRPGAIPKHIRDIMFYFNGPCSCMPSDLKTCITYNDQLVAEQVIARKPTLKVVRKNGLYYVCMNPLKPSHELTQSQNPYLDDCPPIKFQIALNGQSSDDNDLGLLGYPCSGRPAICDDNKEMQDLLKLLAEECENDNEFYKLAKTLCSKPSDLDIEFIAPGANLRENLIYREQNYRETQYDKNDFGVAFGKSVSRSSAGLSRKKSKAA